MLAYAFPGFALSLAGIPVALLLPRFYTDAVGVSMATFGLVSLLVRAADAFVDPLCGTWSDRTRTRFGRRRPWILVGGAMLALGVLWLYIPPRVSGMGLTLWVTGGLVAFYVSWSVLTIPWRSLGPELTSDYDERTTMFGWRDGLVVLGCLVAAAVPELVIGPLIGSDGSPEGERSKFLAYAWIVAPLLIVAAIVCFRGVPEAPAAMPVAPQTGGHFSGARDALKNRPFRILLVAFSVAAFASNLPASLLPYYAKYVLGSDHVVPIAFAEYFVIGLIALPLWIRFATRFGKRAAFITATAINIGAFSFVFFVGPGETGAYLAIVAISGIGGTASWTVLPNSMQADVFDYDELLSGQRREGQFMGLWSIADKLAQTVGIGVALPILDWAGYLPNVTQTETTLFTLRVLYVLVPVICNVLAILVVVAYPIDRARHAAIQLGIARRRRGEAVEDPLRPGVWLAGTVPDAPAITVYGLPPVR